MSDSFPASHRICDIRATEWQSVPDEPGVYWWFFPESHIDRLQISSFADVDSLELLVNENDMVGLYVGVAKSLQQRTRWHANQTLDQSTLRSRALSTFRNTLLSLTEIDYATGFDEINKFMDSLEVVWQVTNSKESAEEIEAKELGEFSLPLNIMHNQRPELARYIRFLKQQRKKYREKHLESES